MTNPNDSARDAILRHLYSVHSLARGPRSAALGVRDVCGAMRPLGLKQNEVVRNLDYLVQKGWVAEVVEHRSFRTPDGTVRAADKKSYKISADGIDRLERASLFERTHNKPSVNISNVHGVLVMGDGNVVNEKAAGASAALTALRAAVLKSGELTDTEKLSAASDLESLQSQLQKPEPDKTVVGRIWSGIEKTVTGADFVDLVVRVAAMLAPFIHRA